ncbi:UDP-N-acetylglucosamine 2-epimerase (non-hydrolyzing) [Oceanospirillaceae bacterium]|nr:UDP-N-acetylglucosamine 2-epimerase (non-hydrolyzing) [Oceanospirillaceae bacterium]
MLKIVTILGARPQFIKAGSVSREIAKHSELNEVIVHTGQHYDENMSDVFFSEMKIPKPNYFLGIGGKSHGAMTGQMIEAIEDVLKKEMPDFVMVYGDTNSTLAGAISASKLHIKIVHIEAGLRSFNMAMPEEVNRILTDRISTLLFCPTVRAIKNLKNECYAAWNTGVDVILSGDVMQDGALFYKEYSCKPENIKINNQYVLCTIHRAENTDDPIRLSNIINALNEIAKNKQIILPLHPRTSNILESQQCDLSNLTVIDPVGYLNMVWLIDNCDIVMTDSGGLQKEAYFFSKPCLTMRDETEWVELVDGGFNKLVGAVTEDILYAYSNFSFSTEFDNNLYGNGDASKRIVERLLG